MTTGGEGGMITVSNEILWNKLWSNKEHGKSYKAVTEKNSNKGFRFVHESFGSNYRMTEIQAVIGRIQLKKMHSWHLLRLKNANIIWSCAKKLKGLRVPKLYTHIEHAAYKCYVFVNQNELSNNWTRDLIMQEINSLGVPCYSGSCSEVYLEKAFNKNRFRPKENLPNAKKLGEQSLMFLVHPTLNDIEIKKTCDVISVVMKMATK